MTQIGESVAAPGLRAAPMVVDRRLAIDLSILVGLCLALFFFRLGTMALWDQDEGMHAATSKAMVQTGDWMTPTFNGENFYDKPAFFNWFVAGSFVLFGFTELAARLPAALFGLGTVLVTYAVGRRMYDRRFGLIGGVILATSFMFVVMSRAVIHDIALVFATTLTLAAFYFAFSETPERRSRWILLMYAAAGVAMLAKGPIGVLLPAMVVFLFLVIQRRGDLIRQILTHYRGILTFLAIGCPWYVGMALLHDDYVTDFLIGRNFGSFVGAEHVNHVRPWHYFIGVLFGGLFPWSCFLPVAIAHGVGPPGRRHRPAFVFLLVWLLTIFLFFSLASSKNASYIVPLFPAAALIVAYSWRDLYVKPLPGQRSALLVTWLFLVGAPLAVVVYILLAGVPADMLERGGLATAYMVIIGALVVGGTFTGFLLALARQYRAAFWSTAGVVVATSTFVLGFLGPSIETHHSTRDLAAGLDRLVAPGEPIAMFQRVEGVGDTVLFYTDRKAIVLPNVEELHRYLDTDEVVYFLAEQEHLAWFEDFAHRVHLIAEQGSKVILSNHPVSATTFVD